MEHRSPAAASASAFPMAVAAALASDVGWVEPAVTLEKISRWSDPDQRICSSSPNAAGSETPTSSFLSFADLLTSDDTADWAGGHGAYKNPIARQATTHQPIPSSSLPPSVGDSDPLSSSSSCSPPSSPSDRSVGRSGSPSPVASPPRSTHPPTAAARKIKIWSARGRRRRGRMGAWMSRVWFLMFPAREYKLVVVGLDNAGKITTLYKLHLGEAVTAAPDRAAAAAAAARAIAGLPPHERINLPSNSEDLVSIYGNNPQGQPVEELEEVFYEEEFDPIKYILQNISDEGGDTTYFDKQSTLRLAQLDKIAERLSHHVMGHHEEMVKGMQSVMELEQDLKVANVICMNGRRHITSSKNEVSRDLVVNVKSKKKQALLDVLPILTELRHALDMQMELEIFVEKENYFQSNHRCVLAPSCHPCPPRNLQISIAMVICRLYCS